MSETNVLAWMTLVGMILTVGGLLLLFFFALPFKNRTGGATYLLAEEDDDEEKKLEKRHDILQWTGLVLTLLGTVIQACAVARGGGII